MRNSAIYALGLIAVGAASCSEGPAQDLTAPGILAPAAAEIETFNERVPVSFLAFIPCADDGAGELVQLEGILHSVFHVTISGNHFTMKTHDQPQGIHGTGLTTGEKYRATGVTQETFSGSFVNGRFSDTYINNFRIIGRGRGNNLLIHETVHVALNAHGELTTDRANFSTECR